MFPCSPRVVTALLTLALLWAGTGWASEIVMKDGTVYSGVTIIRRDAAGVECYARKGKITLPMYEISDIDGVSVSLTSEPAPAYLYPAASPRPTQPKALLSPSLALPSATPRRSNIVPVTPTPSAAPRPPMPSATPMGTPRPAAPPVATPTPKPRSPTPAKPANFTTLISWPTAPNWLPPMEHVPWRDLGIAVFAASWLASVLRVGRDGRESKAPSARWWLLTAAVLPVAGYLLYELSRLIQRQMHAKGGSNTSRYEFIFLDADHRPIMIEPGETGSGLENSKGVLQAAIFDRASDVHIEPGAGAYRVRFRIDGLLHPRMTFPSQEGLRMVSALKNVAQLDISERRKAQDGRFGGRAGGREVDFRAATTPSVHGEKLVLRILDQKSGVRGLADLGMNQKMMERFAEVIQFRSGMILATGPTGSGKTSSLYAALTQLDAVRLNIVTIEDPVEYELNGATQIPVNVKAGVTYESGLRSILRQDPDVILVGEMRDLEAAQIALRSALTGHLVFSSLHTRDAIGTIHRLEEMGIERHLVASSLLVVLSQRLVRVLCQACRKPVSCAGNELIEIGIELPAGETIYQPAGCRHCEGSGYVGRTGIFEMLVLDEKLRQEINDGAPEDAFTRSARTEGYRDYREDGAEKVLLGITSADEVLKAI